MPSLADFFNSPTELEFEGKTYRLRQPTLVEQGQFQRWLEQRAYDAIERRTYQDPAQQDRDRNALTRDVAAGEYEFGGPLAVQALQTPGGLAKLLQIVLADQGVTAELAGRLVDQKLREIAAVLVSKLGHDPNSLGATLATLGLPADWFSSSSATPRSTGRSPNSGDSPTTS